MSKSGANDTSGGVVPDKDKVFDYRALRLVIGILALALPILVSIFSNSPEPLPSISASYHTDSRDIFVGILFVVGAFLFAYNGEDGEAKIANVACVAAIGVACFPTSKGCESNLIGWIHYGSAILLFGILAYFCLVPFRKRVKGKSGKKGRRNNIYFTCGILIICAMAFCGLAALLPCEFSRGYELTYWAEFVALWSFGVAWFVAGKALPVLTDESERLKIF